MKRKQFFPQLRGDVGTAAKCGVLVAAHGGRQHMLYHLIKAASGAGRSDTNIINCAGHRHRGHAEAVAAASLTLAHPYYANEGCKIIRRPGLNWCRTIKHAALVLCVSTHYYISKLALNTRRTRLK